VFLYDVTRRSTITEVMRIHKLVLRSRDMDIAKGRIPMIILANTRNAKGAGSSHASSGSLDTVRSDLSSATIQAQVREVTYEEGLEFAYSCNCPFYEISTANPADVLNSFQQLMGEIAKEARRKALRETGSTFNGSKQGAWRRRDVASPKPLSVPSGAGASPRKVAEPPESKEELHESLKPRQKAFRYTRVDTEEIKFLYVVRLDATSLCFLTCRVLIGGGGGGGVLWIPLRICS